VRPGGCHVLLEIELSGCHFPQRRPERPESFLGMVQFWVAASSAAWGWQNSQSGATIPKSFGFEDATLYATTSNVTRNLTYLNHAVFCRSSLLTAALKNSAA